jgi:hypothetical protein
MKEGEVGLETDWLKFLISVSSDLFQCDFDFFQLVELFAYVDFYVVFLEEALVKGSFEETSFLFQHVFLVHSFSPLSGGFNPHLPVNLV